MVLRPGSVPYWILGHNVMLSRTGCTMKTVKECVSLDCQAGIERAVRQLKTKEKLVS